MERREFAIVGGGMGGCSASALLHAGGHDVVLLEKEPTLGGCASTFVHKKRLYNAGATTVSGYFEGGILKRLFDDVGVRPDLIESDPAIVVIQNGFRIRRTPSLDLFLKDVQAAFDMDGHEPFWRLVHEITRTFYTIEPLPYYSNRSLLEKLISLSSFYPMIKHFGSYLFAPARSVIERFYGVLSRDYRDFLDAQIMIVAQAHLEEVSFFTAAVALGYTFMPTHYPRGGMGRLCHALVDNVDDVRTGAAVANIEVIPKGYRLEGSFGVIETRHIVTGSSIFDTGKWFADQEIRRYYDRFASQNNHQSAFVLYMAFRPGDCRFDHHYQIITPKPLPLTLGQSVFVSISDPSDSVMSPDGTLSLTASVHTDARLWLGDSAYREDKAMLQSLLQEIVCATLGIKTESLLDTFAATPKTFDRYLNRTQLGGHPLKRGVSMLTIPSNDSPIRGLYHVGDTVYPAQGWPGVVMGAYNLMRNLRE